MDKPELLTAAQVKKRFDISERTLRRWMTARKLKAYREGAIFYFSAADVARQIEVSLNQHGRRDGGPAPDVSMG